MGERCSWGWCIIRKGEKLNPRPNRGVCFLSLVWKLTCRVNLYARSDALVANVWQSGACKCCKSNIPQVHLHCIHRRVTSAQLQVYYRNVAESWWNEMINCLVMWKCSKTNQKVIRREYWVLNIDSIVHFYSEHDVSLCPLPNIISPRGPNVQQFDLLFNIPHQKQLWLIWGFVCILFSTHSWGLDNFP